MSWCLRSTDTVVDATVWRLCQQFLQTLLFFGGEVFFGEFYIECNVEDAKHVVILEVGHTLVLLTDACSGPGNFVACHRHFVTIEMRNV